MLQSTLKIEYVGSMMRYEIVGEPRSAVLAAVIQGVPAGLPIRRDAIDVDVARWATASGCAEETPGVVFHAGVSEGHATGAPIMMTIDNEAYAQSCARRVFKRTVPCPGGIEAAGMQKYDLDDSDLLEYRCDARLDAMRVAAAGIAREFLADFGVDILSCVSRIGKAGMHTSPFDALTPPSPLDIETSSCRCPSFQATRSMEIEMARARVKGDTLGGEFELGVFGLMAGLGTPCREGGSLASRMARAAFSIEGVSGVEFGSAGRHELAGDAAHDALRLDASSGLLRATNRAGGIEGGLSTGMPLIMRVHVAPSERLGRDIPSIDMETLEEGSYRAPVFSCCEVPAQAIVAESEAAFAIANAYIDKFGSDAMDDIRVSVSSYAKRLKRTAR